MLRSMNATFRLGSFVQEGLVAVNSTNHLRICVVNEGPVSSIEMATEVTELPREVRAKNGAACVRER